MGILTIKTTLLYRNVMSHVITMNSSILGLEYNRPLSGSFGNVNTKAVISHVTSYVLYQHNYPRGSSRQQR